MLMFFIEGGIAMWPILVLGLLLVGTSTRYMFDLEPVRLRFALVLGLALVAAAFMATILDVSLVLKHSMDVPPEQFSKLLAAGLKESTRPGILAFGLLALALDFIAIGAYRAGRRELKAARG